MCPQLQHLAWSSANGWEHSRQFLSPHLVSISFWLSVNDHRADFGLDSAISSLPTTRLETLSLAGDVPWTAYIQPALSEVVQRLNTCFKRIDAWSSLSDAAWGHLASLPKLESLYLVDTPSIEVLKSISHEPTFPALEHMVLELRDYYYQHLPVLFSLLKSTSLKEVTIRGSRRVRPVALPSEVAIAMRKTELHRSITVLVFTGFYPADLTFVSHLRSFSSLETLECDTRCQELQCVFPLTDSDIEQLARGLPRLVTLRLGHPCNFSNPNTTIKSMISLSTHCPSLDTLCLPCNLTNIYEDVRMESGEPDPRLETRSSCALRVLAFNWMIRPESIEALGIMKSALRHLFPHWLRST